MKRCFTVIKRSGRQVKNLQECQQNTEKERLHRRTSETDAKYILCIILHYIYIFIYNSLFLEQGGKLQELSRIRANAYDYLLFTKIFCGVKRQGHP
jgi:hypothetical protein